MAITQSSHLQMRPVQGRRSFTTPIRRCSRPRSKDLADLLNGEVGLLAIEKFLPRDTVGAASTALKQKMGHKEYENAPGVGKLGDVPCLYETKDDTQLKESYYAHAEEVMEEMKACFPSEEFPIDKIRKHLEDCHKAGVKMADFEGKGNSYAGLCRIMSATVLAHNDKLERDLKTTTASLDYISQLAFNFFFEVPDRGSQLMIWNIDLPQDEYDRLCDGKYGIEPELLGTPDVIYRPKAGEAFMFVARNMHAVTQSYGQESLSMSAFIAYGGPDKPLRLWS